MLVNKWSIGQVRVYDQARLRCGTPKAKEGHLTFNMIEALRCIRPPEVPGGNGYQRMEYCILVHMLEQFL